MRISVCVLYAMIYPPWNTPSKTSNHFVFGTYLCPDIARHINRFLCMFLLWVFGNICLFLSGSFWLAPVKLTYCMYILHIKLTELSVCLLDFCRTFCGFFRRANWGLPTQNLVWTLASAHEHTGRANFWTERRNWTVADGMLYGLYGTYAILYMLYGV